MVLFTAMRVVWNRRTVGKHLGKNSQLYIANFNIFTIIKKIWVVLLNILHRKQANVFFQICTFEKGDWKVVGYFYLRGWSNSFSTWKDTLINNNFSFSVGGVDETIENYGFRWEMCCIFELLKQIVMFSKM